MELIKERAGALEGPCAKGGLIAADFSVNIWVAGDYDVYYRSAAHELLCHTAMEAAKRPDTLFTIPMLVKGYLPFDTPGRAVL